MEKREVPLVLAVVLFVLTWPLEKRHLIYTDYSFITGAFTEAGTIALYASDIAFVLLGLAWVWWKAKAGAPLSMSLPRPAFWVGIVLVAWAVFRSLPLHPSPLGWYAAARVAQGFLLMLIVADLWQRPHVRSIVLGSIVVLGVLQSLLGIAQVSRSSDLRLMFLGEHPLSLTTPGVAKVDIVKLSSSFVNVPVGTKVMRAYGTFPHPNVLGWFLIASTYSALTLILSPNGGSRKVRGPEEHSQVSRRMFLAEHPIPSLAILAILVSGILVTFSRGAWVGLLFLEAGFLLNSLRRVDKRLIRSVMCWTMIGITVPILLGSSVRQAVVSRLLPPETDMFLRERSSSYRESLRAIRGNFLIGVGAGGGITSIVRSKNNIDKNNFLFSRIEKEDVPLGTTQEPWMFQYPHNVPLVILLELGAVGLCLFLAMAYLLFSPYMLKYLFISSLFPRRVGTLLVFAAFLLAALVDHFPWTIQQGRILLWGLLGAAVSLGREKSLKANGRVSGGGSLRSVQGN